MTLAHRRAGTSTPLPEHALTRAEVHRCCASLADVSHQNLPSRGPNVATPACLQETSVSARELQLDAMKERGLPLPGGCWKVPSIRLHQIGRASCRERVWSSVDCG